MKTMSCRQHSIPQLPIKSSLGGLYPDYNKSKPDELLFRFKEGTLIKAANRAMKNEGEKIPCSSLMKSTGAISR